MDKAYLAFSLAFLGSGFFFYIMFLGEMGKSSYIPLREILFENITTIEAVQKDHYSFFSGRIALSQDKIEDPWAGISWILGEQPSCELVGELLAYTSVMLAENFSAQEWDTNKIRDGLGAVSLFLNSTQKSEPLEIMEIVRQRTDLNVTLDRVCVADAYGGSLKDFAEWEGNRIITEYFRSAYIPATYRSEVMVRLWNETS